MTIKKYIESEKEINENSLLKSKNTCISELNQQQGIDMDAAITAVDNLMVILDIEFADFEGCPVRSGRMVTSAMIDVCLSRRQCRRFLL
ncbi:hypothetical protein QVD99_000586 [Batrachochytrium dendrobatidis]|nr:hypothetical protein QVD99_000586 [Batrachochytrium dendrobatidis]